jgi:hypothetical protein
MTFSLKKFLGGLSLTKSLARERDDTQQARYKECML